jgi:hypothetical protein
VIRMRGRAAGYRRATGGRRVGGLPAAGARKYGGGGPDAAGCSGPWRGRGLAAASAGSSSPAGPAAAQRPRQQTRW